MQQIRELDEDAYNYLENIPTHHWCRHAFSDSCRSNMLLNNMCETFNSVIRDARDKPILTQMEWMRRYMMRRNNEKWEDSKEITTNITPYVHKLFQRMSYVARNCIIEAARDDTYEVQLNDDQVLVDLPNWSCSCNHWQLTGIPCIHAFACIMDQRVDVEQFVHPYYAMDTYRAAYEPAIQPMPGPKHWERVNMREPHPPAFKQQPGRPKQKKRKLEPGEGTSATGGEQGRKRRKSQCRICGGFGHYPKTCKGPHEPEPTEQRTAGRPPLNSPWVVEQRKKREIKAAKKSAIGAGPNSIGNRTFPQEQQGQPQAKHHTTPSSSQPEPNATGVQTRRAKLLTSRQGGLTQ
ncbi:uncharacterized protein LOC110690102 [Chenopodium quinoa]|uniref:uncharacterized protein LOC110690102 n=1 Tax=Chenopodium quinoa TaxID=63459 RepID=UPI000B77CD92|nr:uncharacterized protein LOC110690102 [Chenopodium quinoa]